MKDTVGWSVNIVTASHMRAHGELIMSFYGDSNRLAVRNLSIKGSRTGVQKRVGCVPNKSACRMVKSEFLTKVPSPFLSYLTTSHTAARLSVPFSHHRADGNVQKVKTSNYKKRH
jgi:hypothetical protein